MQPVGGYFHDRKDQDAMLGILKETQKEHARPTAKVQEKMLAAWGRSRPRRDSAIGQLSR